MDRPLMRVYGLALIATALVACSFEPAGLSPGDAGGAPDGGGDAATADAGQPDACVPTGGAEECNGLDDDCNGTIDDGFDFTTPCDGPDADECEDDLPECAPGGEGTVCADGGDNEEQCNDADDDCDGMTDEGFVLGGPCDGDDDDLCEEGVVVCDGSGEGTLCDDATPTNVELCNDDDDDCDGTTDEGFGLGTPCDGADTDLCTEGVVMCDGAGGALCSDGTPNNLEVCDDADNDCDGMTDEDFDFTDEVSNCGDCDTQCVNGSGTTACVASLCVPVCSLGAADCDGDPVNGCEPRDSNPVCTTTVTDLGDITGDDGTDPLTFPFATTPQDGYGEAFFRVTVSETVSGGGGAIEARVDLAVPADADFDLFVTCTSCGGTLSDSSATVGLGTDESASVSRADAGGDQDYDLIIEVRYGPAAVTTCSEWTLTVTGNATSGTAGTCG